MGVRQHSGKLLAVGAFETETLPEGSGPAAEQPCALCALFGRASQRERREPRSRTCSLYGWMHRHASNKSMLVVCTEFEAGRGDYLAPVVSLGPDAY